MQAQKTNIAYTHYEVMMALEENNFFIKTEIINKNDVCDKVVKENTNSSASSLITNKNNQKFFVSYGKFCYCLNKIVHIIRNIMIFV